MDKGELDALTRNIDVPAVATALHNLQDVDALQLTDCMALHEAETVVLALPQLIAYVERYQWQSMSTAPKDGTPIMAYRDTPGFTPLTGIDVIWRDGADWFFGNAAPIPFTPTHWMPLPAPPLSSGAHDGK